MEGCGELRRIARRCRSSRASGRGPRRLRTSPRLPVWTHRAAGSAVRRRPPRPFSARSATASRVAPWATCVLEGPAVRRRGRRHLRQRANFGKFPEELRFIAGRSASFYNHGNPGTPGGQTRRHGLCRSGLQGARLCLPNASPSHPFRLPWRRHLPTPTSGCRAADPAEAMRAYPFGPIHSVLSIRSIDSVREPLQTGTEPCWEWRFRPPSPSPMILL